MRVLGARFQVLWEVDEDCASVAPVVEPASVEKYLVDFEGGMQIELNAFAVAKHSEADRVLALKKFFVRVDTDIQMVEEQIVVGAMGP